VCHGNICRSPYAAIALKRTPHGKALQITSAGFIGPGRPSPEPAQAAAKEFAIDLSSHRSQILTQDLLNAHDLVVVMEPAQAAMVRDRFAVSRERLLVLGDLDHDAGHTRTIPDPYGGDTELFRACYQRLERCVSALAEVLER
jgi:protein-tyrosine phosphatase